MISCRDTIELHQNIQKQTFPFTLSKVHYIYFTIYFHIPTFKSFYKELHEDRKPIADKNKS